MNRRGFLGLLSGAVIASPLSARGQQSNAPVIGFLGSRSPAGSTSLIAALRQGLSEQGYIEGQNVAIEYRWAEGRYERLPELAADLVNLQVALIVATGGDRPALAAKAATSTIPIVFTGSDNPVKFGLVASLSHPGSNITGVSLFTSELEVKRFEPGFPRWVGFWLTFWRCLSKGYRGLRSRKRVPFAFTRCIYHDRALFDGVTCWCGYQIWRAEQGAHQSIWDIRVELLRELVPGAALIAMLVNPNNPTAETDTKDVQTSAGVVGQQLIVVKAGSEQEIDTALETLVQQHTDALLVAHDPFFNSRRHQLVALAARSAIPAIYEFCEFVLAGGLMSYGSRLEENYYLGGIYAGRILNGAKPADLPVQQPTKFELVINLKTAVTLDLTIPPSLLA